MVVSILIFIFVVGAFLYSLWWAVGLYKIVVEHIIHFEIYIENKEVRKEMFTVGLAYASSVLGVVVTGSLIALHICILI